MKILIDTSSSAMNPDIAVHLFQIYIFDFKFGLTNCNTQFQGTQATPVNLYKLQPLSLF